ncbi:hypothetical protein BJ166DRAFT_527124 [Pestalotiopsis sp. NC0098]|nr:hypothetical protein BJ166DRAFT_527124 [Pestalotiopsis sp. NC0098]
MISIQLLCYCLPPSGLLWAGCGSGAHSKIRGRGNTLQTAGVVSRLCMFRDPCSCSRDGTVLFQGTTDGAMPMD